MSTDNIAYDDEDINVGAANVEAQADAAEAAASEAEGVIEAFHAAASNFQSTYEPDAVHQQRVTEMTDLLTARIAYARSLAARLRELAQNMRTQSQVFTETQEDAAANTDDIDTEFDA